MGAVGGVKAGRRPRTRRAVAPRRRRASRVRDAPRRREGLEVGLGPFRDAVRVRRFGLVQDGYEFFAQRQLVTLFSAPNYCGEFDNSGAVMSVDASLMCSFHILKPRSAAPGTPDTVGRGAR